MPKPIESRSIRVSIDIQERREDSYSSDVVASSSLTIPLPASSDRIGRAVAGAIEQLALNAELFRGPVSSVIESDLTVNN